jgi:hypothetical protein
VRRSATPDRRSVLLGAALTTGLATTACSAGREPELKHPQPPKASASATAAAARAEKVDSGLRARAVAQEKRLLAACAAPAGQEPFASVRAMHLAHLKRLTGSAVAAPKAAKTPVAATLAAQERTAAAALRADCLRSSPGLAPVLASIAASAEVAAILLAP